MQKYYILCLHILSLCPPPINSAPWTGLAVPELQGQGVSTFGAMSL